MSDNEQLSAGVAVRPYSDVDLSVVLPDQYDALHRPS